MWLNGCSSSIRPGRALLPCQVQSMKGPFSIEQIWNTSHQFRPSVLKKHHLHNSRNEVYHLYLLTMRCSMVVSDRTLLDEELFLRELQIVDNLGNGDCSFFMYLQFLGRACTAVCFNRCLNLGNLPFLFVFFSQIIFHDSKILCKFNIFVKLRKSRVKLCETA